MLVDDSVILDPDCRLKPASPRKDRSCDGPRGGIICPRGSSFFPCEILCREKKRRSARSTAVCQPSGPSTSARPGSRPAVSPAPRPRHRTPSSTDHEGVTALHPSPDSHEHDLLQIGDRSQREGARWVSRHHPRIVVLRPELVDRIQLAQLQLDVECTRGGAAGVGCRGQREVERGSPTETRC